MYVRPAPCRNSTSHRSLEYLNARILRKHASFSGSRSLLVTTARTIVESAFVSWITVFIGVLCNANTDRAVCELQLCAMTVDLIHTSRVRYRLTQRATFYKTPFLPYLSEPCRPSSLSTFSNICKHSLTVVIARAFRKRSS
jgi:hypothetical protein